MHWYDYYYNWLFFFLLLLSWAFLFVIIDGRFNCIFSKHYNTVSMTTFTPFYNLLEQWSLTGGKHNSFAISVFLIWLACSSVKPLTRSVIKLLEAMAEPHPNVLNRTSTIFPVASSTLICNFITSPQAGAPTKPVPTSVSVLGNDPTLRGRS